MKTGNRVVITGIGIVTPFGSNIEIFWQNLVRGESAIKRLDIAGGDLLPVKYGAQVNFQELLVANQASLPETNTTDRRGVMGYIAAQRAIDDAGLTEFDLQSRSMGVYGCSGVVDISEQDRLLCKNSSDPLATLLKNRHMFSAFSGLGCSNDSLVVELAKKFTLTGPTGNVSCACAGGAHAIGMAYQAIRRGEADVMLAGGADSVMSLRTLIGLKLLGATATTEKYKDRLCRPFDKDRSGLVAGEGGAFLLLESEESALKRHAIIYAQIKGYGSSLDAYKLTAPHPNGRGAEQAMRNALKDSGLAPEQIDYINAHGTSTKLNDQIETQVVKAVFSGSKQPLLSSVKSMLGHWIAAAGAIEAVTTVLSIKHNIVPPTINYQRPDPVCDLDYVVNQAREVPVFNAISNSFGFGGINSCLVFGGYDAGI